VPISVEHTMVVENVGSGDQATEKIFKADLFAFGEVSDGHCVCDELLKA
jgi:hypothetical protein